MSGFTGGWLLTVFYSEKEAVANYKRGRLLSEYNSWQRKLEAV